MVCRLQKAPGVCHRFRARPVGSALARSDNRELTAFRRVAFQRLLEHAEDAEVWIRPFVDHDEAAFPATGTERSVVFGRELRRHRMQVYENTHGRFLWTVPPRERPSRKIKSTLWRAAGRSWAARRRTVEEAGGLIRAGSSAITRPAGSHTR